LSRTRRSAWNFGTAFVSTTVTVLLGFVGTPIIIRLLGVERFGAFRVLIDWLGNLALLDFGVSGSVSARLAPRIATGDQSGVFDILAAGLRTELKVTAAMFLGGLGLVVALPHLMHSRSFGATELRLSACILMIPAIWTPLSVFRGLLDARQQSYSINMLLTVQAMLTTCLLIAAAWAGWGLIGQAAGMALAALPLASLLLFRGLAEFRGVFTARPTQAALAEVRSLSLPTFIFSLTSRAALSSDNILIAWIVGPAAVAPFFLTQRLAQVVQSQLQGIGNATWAGMVELHAQGHSGRFCSRLMELTSLVSGIGLVVLIPVAAYNRNFMSLWVGSRQYANDWVTVLACLNAWIWSITSLWGWPISGAGYIAAWTPYAICFAVINIAISVVGTEFAGLAGPLIGTLSGFVLVHVWAMPRVLGQIFGRSLRSLWTPVLIHLIWAVPFGVVVWWMARNRAPVGWLMLAVESGLTALIGLSFCWFGFAAGLRDELWTRLRSVWAS
jgi:O-antigen/teichoic acid export membrane protein